jgi:iron complex outermembrane receptor protein
MDTVNSLILHNQNFLLNFCIALSGKIIKPSIVSFWEKGTMKPGHSIFRVSVSRSMFITLFLLCGYGFICAPVFAQEQEVALEEVVVTAQKREESLQEVPIAITAFSGEVLREDGVVTLHDISEKTPNLVFSAFSPGQPEIAIRGIGTKEDGAAASDSVVVSVDDIYIAARTAQVFDIFDLERIEVLRGPQGTLYGKNSIAGSINFVTTKPSADTLIRLAQTVGDYGRLDTGGLISGGLSENVAGKFSFSRRKFDGYLENLLFDEDWGEAKTLAMRAQLLWTAAEKVDILFGADWSHDDLGATNREPIGSTGPLHDCGCVSDPVAVNEALGGAGDAHDTLAETEGFTDRNVFGINAKVVWDIRNMEFVSITSYRTSDFDWLEDSEGLPPSPYIDLTGASGSPVPGLTLPPENGFSFDVNDSAVEDTKQFTQEFRLLGESGRGMTWVTGAFFSKEKIERSERFAFTALGGPGPDQLSDYQANQKNDATSWALYAQATYPLAERWNLTGGLRYSYDEKKIVVSNERFSGIPLLLQAFDPTSAKEDWNHLSWRLALDYRFNDDVMAYGSISTGFKSGGFTGAASTQERATTPFDEETATSYEIGLKALWANRRLQTNLAAFYVNYDDLQVTRFFQPEGGIFGEFITENAGKAKPKGIELEFVGLITDSFQVGGSFAYLNAKYSEFFGTPDVTGGGDFSGNRMRQAPKYSFYIYASYVFTLQNSSQISAKVDYAYQDDMFFDPNNNPITIAPSYDLWNARLAWTSASDRWEVAGWIKNIGDEDYIHHTFSQRGSRIAFGRFGPPRHYGVTVTYKYAN